MQALQEDVPANHQSLIVTHSNMQSYSHVQATEHGSSVLNCNMTAQTSEEPNVVMSNIQNNQMRQQTLEEFQLQTTAANAEQFSEVVSTSSVFIPGHDNSTASTVLQLNTSPTYETTAITAVQLPCALTDREVVIDGRSGYAISNSGDIITVPRYTEMVSGLFSSQKLITQNLPTMTDGHTVTCQTLPVSSQNSTLKDAKHDNTNGKTQGYLCGACSQTFSSICILHDHLIGHVETGSYYYNSILRVAFPKFDSICSSTQTDNTVKDEISSPNNTLAIDSDNILTGTVSEPENINMDIETSENACDSESMHSVPVITDITETSDLDSTMKSAHNLSIEKMSNVHLKSTFSGGNKLKRSAKQCPKLTRSRKSTCSGKSNETTEVKCIAKEASDNLIMNDGVGKQMTLKSAGGSNLTIGSLTDIQEVNTDTSASTINEVTYEGGTEYSSKRKRNKARRMKKISEKLRVICSLCSRTFQYSKGLRRHERICHPEDLKFECDICLEKFVWQKDLDSHKSLSHVYSKRQKLKQSRSSKTKNVKLQKRERGHSKLNTKANKHKLINSEEDQQRTVRSEILWIKSEDHGAVKPNEPNVIPETRLVKPEVASSEQDSKPVIRTAKVGTSIYQCDVCDIKISKKSAEIHQRLHSGERPFVCEVCGKGLISENCLARHMKVHSDLRPYSCGLCSASFKDSYKLRRHQVIHSGERRYLCSVCGADFTQSASLVQHIKGVHLQLKPFKCDVCGARFGAKRARDDHLMSHTDERTNTCKYCGKQLKYLQGLRRHEKSHIEEKKYYCDICPSSFKRKDNLLRHKQAHLKVAGECKICGKKFQDEKVFKEHMKVHLHFDQLSMVTPSYEPFVGESSQPVTDNTVDHTETAVIDNGEQSLVPDMRLTPQPLQTYMNTAVGTTQLAETPTVTLPPLVKAPNLNQSDVLQTHLTIPSQLNELSVRSMSGLESSYLPDMMPPPLHIPVCCDHPFSDLKALQDHIELAHRVRPDRPSPKPLSMENMLYNMQHL